MTDAERADLPALGALLLLDLVAAVCLARLFTSVEAVAPVIAGVLIGHAVAFACRLRNLDSNATGAAIIGSAVISAIWLVLPHHTSFGIPTPDTLSAFVNGIGDARRDFGVAIAPTNPTEGFTLACVMAVVVLAGLADWAAFRIRTTIEAAVPAFTLFLFAGVLGTAHHRGTATVAFVGALLVWFVTDNATIIARARPWFHGTAEAGRKAVSRAGVGIGVIGIVGTLIGLALPFAQDPPAVAWRNRNQNQARTTTSPLVDIRPRLVARSDEVAFTVDTPLRSYWRLTALDAFDGEIWASHGNYKRVDSDDNLGGRSGEVVKQTFSIGSLNSIWLPAAYRPASTPSVEGISFDSDADAFITEQPTSDGIVYSVRSAVQDFNADALRRARPASVDDSQLELPGNIDDRVRTLALTITAGKQTAYDKALAIQQYLRSSPFRYDLTIESGHSNDALARFLFITKRGYCEQFAGSYAVLARYAGLPSRVAVGFTAGERDENSGTWTVRELHAHAWPEVFLGSAGWVAFEPTPGRGIPGAENYTGVAESQANTQRPTIASTAVPTTTVTQPSQTGATTTITPPTTVAPQAEESDRGLGVFALVLVVIAAIAGLIGAVPAIAAARRRRRFASATTPADKVLVAWNDTEDALRFAGAPVRRSHTPTERVGSVDEAIGEAMTEGGVATLTRLAEVVDAAAYAPEPITDQAATQAWTDAGAVRRHAFAVKPKWKALVYAIDPRRLRRGR